MQWDAIIILSPVLVMALFAFIGCCQPHEDDKTPKDRVKEIADAVEKAFWGF